MLGGSYPGRQGAVQGTPPSGLVAPPEAGLAVPDSGISAWRSLFVCNELKLGAMIGHRIHVIMVYMLT